MWVSLVGIAFIDTPPLYVYLYMCINAKKPRN
jgi:hypothetical protein